jgi:hypothetical protein
MTNPYRALLAELLLFSEEAGEICMNESLWPKSDPNCTLLDRARALLDQQEPEGPEGSYFTDGDYNREIHYAWELEDAEGEWQAGGSANSLEDVQREGNRYLQTYSQDGPHKLIIQRHCVTTIEESTNDYPRRTPSHRRRAGGPMTAKEAKKLIGQKVTIQRRYSGIVDHGTILSVKGRNVLVDFMGHDRLALAS